MLRKMLILLVVLGLGFAPAAVTAGKTTLVWSAGSAGGGWYQMAGGIAAIIGESDPDIVIKVVPGGGVKNSAILEAGSVDMAWGLPFMNAAAQEGIPPFDNKHTHLRAIAGGMSESHLHFYLGEGVKYNSMDEVFNGKNPVRLAISQPGSSDVWIFEKILEAYNTSIADLQKKGYHFARGNYAFQANQFKDKNVDGVFTFLASPGAAVIEASIGRKLKLIPFSDTATKYLAQFGIYSCQIPAGTYPKAANGDQPVKTCCSGCTIMVNASMSDEMAYRITKAFNENYQKVNKVHASLSAYRPELGPTGLAIPLHPGAEKYYREKALLK